MFVSPFPDVEIPDVSLPDFVLEKFKKHGDKIAMIDDVSGREISFREFHDEVITVARSLQTIGFEKNDVVGLMLPNVVEYAILLYGTLLAGGTVAGIIPYWIDAEAADVIENAGPRYIFTLSNLAGKAHRINVGNSNMQEVFVIGADTTDHRSYKDFLLACTGSVYIPVSICPKEDTAILTYTTGTTGRRKGVMLSHYNLVANIHQVQNGPLTPDDVVIATRPATHGYGLVLHFTHGLSAGATHVFVGDSEPKTLLRAIEKYKVTMIPFTPSNLVQLAKCPDVGQYVTSSMRTVACSGAPLTPEVRTAFVEKLKIESIRNLFGMSEVCIILAQQQGDTSTTCGVLRPNVTAKVVEPATGREVGVNQQGELWIKSPSVFTGYKHQPEAYDETFSEDGWFKTGDVCFCDEDQKFHIIDRIKEFICFNSINVSPSELEGVIMSLPGVQEVGVVGVPDMEYTELPRAFVVRQPDSGVTREQIESIVAGQLSDHKRLRGGVEFVDSLPKSPTGKVMRRLVREAYLARIAQ